jgi:hypothetical protein
MGAVARLAEQMLGAPVDHLFAEVDLRSRSASGGRYDCCRGVLQDADRGSDVFSVEATLWWVDAIES